MNIQLLHIDKVVGQAFIIKATGEIIAVTPDITLTIGDVLLTKANKHAWLVDRNGEQIDVLNRACLISTRGFLGLDINLGSVTTEPSAQAVKKAQPELQIHSEELVMLYGLTNEQAKSLLLTRYQDYFTKLASKTEISLSFEPQVYRIAENQRQEFSAKELAAFIKGAKSRDFSIIEVQAKPEEAEISYDSDRISIMPTLLAGCDMHLMIRLSNGTQEVSGELSFVLQPAETKTMVKLVPHQLTLSTLTANCIVADIQTQGFDEKALTFSLVNDPNGYFFRIEKQQVLLTQEGVHAIINKTLPLDEMQISLQAADQKYRAQAVIEIPLSNQEGSKDSKDIARSLAHIKQQSVQNDSVTKAAQANPSQDNIEVPALNRSIGTKLNETHVHPQNESHATTKSEQTKIEPTDAILVDASYFYLTLNNTSTDCIKSFAPLQDKINLIGILDLKEKALINKHLFLENDSAGTMRLNISSSGNGEVNKQFVFDNLNIEDLAASYQLNISNLSNAQISHILLKSMLNNASLIL